MEISYMEIRNLYFMYDLIIIGTGPAGYAGSIYANRYGLKNLLIGAMPGGMAIKAHKICNFPSEKEISGIELMQKMQDQVQSFEGKIIFDEVVKIKKEKSFFSVTTKNKKQFKGKTLLLAIGTKRRKLNLPDEDKYLGKGISYCFSCDGFFFKNKTVAVVGAGDSANTASLFLANIAKKVYQICLEEKLQGEKNWQNQIAKNPKIENIYKTKIISVSGKEKLEEITIDRLYKGKNKIKLDGLFIEIGSIPDRTLIDQLKIKTNSQDFIIVDQNQSTSLAGVWAAGDITTGSNNFKQIITACSEGAIAVYGIAKFLRKK